MHRTSVLWGYLCYVPIFYDDICSEYAYDSIVKYVSMRATCNDGCLILVVAISTFPWYDWLEVNVPLSIRTKIRMISKDGKHEWGPKVTFLA